MDQLDEASTPPNNVRRDSSRSSEVHTMPRRLILIALVLPSFVSHIASAHPHSPAIAMAHSDRSLVAFFHLANAAGSTVGDVGLYVQQTGQARGTDGIVNGAYFS